MVDKTCKRKYNLKVSDKIIKGKKYSAVVLTVAHKQFSKMSLNDCTCKNKWNII